MFSRKLFLLLIGLFLFCQACSSSGILSAAPVTLSTPGGSVNLIAADPNATATPTPFQPQDPTPTYLPTAMPTIQPAPPDESTGGTSGAPWDAIPAAPLTQGDRVNILLLGSDQRPYEGGFRTDTIILLSLDPENGTASMVSFPRDLYLLIPGWTYQRINTAMGYGGFPLLAQTLSYNFGVTPSYYVMVNFWAFEQTIDSLDGIDVEVAQSLTDERYGKNYTVPAGIVHMDGETALWYVRARYTTSDFDRTRRQQEVIRALLDRLLSLNGVERAPELYDIYIENVTTNLTWKEIAPLVPLAALLSDTSRIHQYYIGGSEVVPWTTPGGAQVLLPQTEAIIAILQQAMSSP